MKDFLIYSHSKTVFGNILNLYEMSEIVTNDSNTEYYRVDLIIEDSVIDNFHMLNKLSSPDVPLIDNVAIEDVPLCIKLINILNPTKVEVEIVDFSAGEFFSNVILYKDNDKLIQSCNINEILDIVTFFPIPIKIDNKVLNKVSKIAVGGHITNKKPNLESDSHVSKLEKLKNSLEEAIKNDDFEKAKEISNQIENLKQNK